MKIILFIVMFIFSCSLFAQCEKHEAQFVGTVRALKMYQDHYTFQIKLGFKGDYWFRPSMMCPLWEDEAEEAVIEVAGAPQMKNDEEISGVLVFDLEKNHYFID
jgi:hypothetical protein